MGNIENPNPPKSGSAMYRFEDLMDQNRSVPEAYKELILKQKRDYLVLLDAAYSDAWKFLYDETAQEQARIALRKNELTTFQEIFREHLQDGTLVDVGGGMGTVMRDFAKHFGAHGYINVEMPTASQQDFQVPMIDPLQKRDGDFLAIDVYTDMLAFVS